MSKGTESQIGPGFGQVLLELIETERTYMAGLDALLQSYRPALQPLAPSVLTPVFGALEAIHVTSEELLGKVEFILEGYLLHAEHAASAPPARAAPVAGPPTESSGPPRRSPNRSCPSRLSTRPLRTSWGDGAVVDVVVVGGGGSGWGSAAESEHHPLYRYRSYVNQYEHALRGLASLMGVSRLRQERPAGRVTAWSARKAAGPAHHAHPAATALSDAP